MNNIELMTLQMGKKQNLNQNPLKVFGGKSVRTNSICNTSEIYKLMELFNTFQIPISLFEWSL